MRTFLMRMNFLYVTDVVSDKKHRIGMSENQRFEEYDIDVIFDEAGISASNADKTAIG